MPTVSTRRDMRRERDYRVSAVDLEVLSWVYYITVLCFFASVIFLNDSKLVIVLLAMNTFMTRPRERLRIAVMRGPVFFRARPSIE